MWAFLNSGQDSTNILQGAIKMFPEFFYIDRSVHHEFVQPGQSGTVQMLQRKRRNKWQAGGDTGSCITIPQRATHRLLRRHPTTVLSGISLFPALKTGLAQGHAMQITESNATAELCKIPKEAFRRNFQQWQDRWSKCVPKDLFRR
jgi:hypothetical protein